MGELAGDTEKGEGTGLEEGEGLSRHPPHTLSPREPGPEGIPRISLTAKGCCIAVFKNISYFFFDVPFISCVEIK